MPTPTALRPRTASWGALVACLAIVFAAAALGALGSRDAPVFYRQIGLPDWAPPAGVFGPVWTVLYTAMAVALWRVGRAAGWRQPAVTWFAVQLVLNVAWSWLFFAWHSGALAFADIVLLDFAVVGTLVAFWRRDRLAAALLLPYFAWILFATALTWSVWHLNPGTL